MRRNFSIHRPYNQSMALAAESPRAEYQTRLGERQQALLRAEATHRRIGSWRLLLFFTAVVLAWLAWVRHAVSAWVILLPLAGFIALIIYHSRVAEQLRLAQRAIRFYLRGLERLDDQWIGKGESGERFRNPSHPYADDLDLFGVGSLFELLSTARTRGGEATLAQWLAAPASPDEVLARQAAVEELRDQVQLREDLAVLGENFRTGVHPEALAAWGSAPRIPFPRFLEVLAPGLALVMVALIIALFTTGLPAVRIALLVLAGLEGALVLPLRARIAEVTSAAEQPGHDLELLSAVLARFEATDFHAPKLAALRAALQVEGQPASRRIGRLQTLIDLLNSRDNVVVRAFGPLVLWTTQIAFALERWRAVSGVAAGQWLQAVGELEALCALAGYAFEHPGDPFPEITQSGTVFQGDSIAHPLLPAAACVRNSVSLAGNHNLLVISGSNMSGKSTLLRTVGVNTVLALAGAPVRAQKLSLSALHLGASIRVTDSLQGGTSRFYAEITRLRDIVQLAETRPTLFLLDELLNGTNSHDRGIGAEGVVRGLLRRQAIGIVTTHDLALTAIADSLAPTAENMHFEDHLQGGVITFDYRIRPGVVRKSNALELMRAVGLEV